MKKHLSIYLGGALGIAALAPSFAHAAINCGSVTQITDIESFLCSFKDLINFSTGVVASLALLVFFWGLVKYIAKADDPKEKEAGKNTMIWGVIALFVMFSVFGLVSFLQASFGVTGTGPVIPPQL
jgi:hypothetical protein